MGLERIESMAEGMRSVSQSQCERRHAHPAPPSMDGPTPRTVMGVMQGYLARDTAGNEMRIPFGPIPLVFVECGPAPVDMDCQSCPADALARLAALTEQCIADGTYGDPVADTPAVVEG